MQFRALLLCVSGSRASPLLLALPDRSADGRDGLRCSRAKERSRTGRKRRRVPPSGRPLPERRRSSCEARRSGGRPQGGIRRYRWRLRWRVRSMPLRNVHRCAGSYSFRNDRRWRHACRNDGARPAARHAIPKAQGQRRRGRRYQDLQADRRSRALRRNRSGPHRHSRTGPPNPAAQERGSEFPPWRGGRGNAEVPRVARPVCAR